MCNTTQKELAEKLGVSEVTLSRASNGNTSLSLLDKIACTLGIEISELFAPSNSVQGCCPSVSYTHLTLPTNSRV